MSVDLFLQVFKFRTDVFAKYYQKLDEHGKIIRAGYYPVCANAFVQGTCPKVNNKKAACGNCPQKLYAPLTDQALIDHFNGLHILGGYPLFPDGNCYLIAADFDDHDGTRKPFQDVLAYVQACNKAGLAAHVLKSKSGRGYHVYNFFTSAVPAWKARLVAFSLLKEAGVIGNDVEFSTFDRLFPNQDSLDQGKTLGNLIAMPVQGIAVQQGHTVFLDPASNYQHPYPGQLSTFQNIQRVTEDDLDRLIATRGLKRQETLGVQKAVSTTTTSAVVTAIPQGQRNNTLTSLAGSMRSRGMDVAAIEAALLIENQSRCVPPLPDQEVITIAQGISRYPAGTSTTTTSGGPLIFNLTDLGNSERLVQWFGDDLRYSYIHNKWFHYDGQIWDEDQSGHIETVAKRTVRLISAEANSQAMEAVRKALRSHAQDSEAASKIRNLIFLAQSFLSINPSQFNADPMLFNCASGTIDLRTGILRAHRRGDYITKMSPVIYDPQAKCDRWLQFLYQITGGDLQLIAYLQEIFGYCLTGSIIEQILFFLYGFGANGKTTVREILRALAGTYAEQAKFDTFVQRQSEAVRNDLAALSAARVVTASEVESGKKLSESLIKDITGGEPLTARFLYGEYFSFMPQFKTIIAGNHKPVILGTDHGIWRRVKMIHFKITIPDDQQDKDLLEKLKQELPGILNWAIAGCLRWQQQGMTEPLEVTRATQEYRADMDILQGFLSERCNLDQAAKISKKELYEAYSAWSEENKEKPLSKRNFGTRLKERGINEGKSGDRVWKGIGLKPVEPGITVPGFNQMSPFVQTYPSGFGDTTSLI